MRLTPQGRSQANIKNKNTEEYFIIPIEGWRVIESLIIPGKKMATPNRPRVDKVNEYCEIVLITKESHLMSLVLADAGDVLPAYIIDGIVYQHDEEGRFRNALPIRNARPAIGQYMLIPELTRYLARYEGGLTEQERGENEQMLGHYLEWTASE